MIPIEELPHAELVRRYRLLACAVPLIDFSPEELLLVAATLQGAPVGTMSAIDELPSKVAAYWFIDESNLHADLDGEALVRKIRGLDLAQRIALVELARTSCYTRRMITGQK